MHWFLVILLLFMCTFTGYAQADTARNWELRGYVKDLRTIVVPGSVEHLSVDNLLHNRFNFRWYPAEPWTLAVEVRNRIFYGETVRSIPNYSELIQTDDWLPLSVTWLDQSAIVGHSVVDRANITWRKNRWEITAGRQRVNWGINGVWNPNDLFNAFSYLDFDYEERPGSDALRIQRHIGFAGRMEVAAKMSDSLEGMVAAGLWAFNHKGFDFQLLAGLAMGDAAIGAGWAGGIGGTGFKGEVTYFEPVLHAEARESAVSATVSFDRTFGKGSYVLVSALFNSDGNDRADASSLAILRPSARMLAPWRYTGIALYSHPISPIMGASMAVITAPGAPAIIANPSLRIGVATNFDIDLIGQLFFSRKSPVFPGQAYLVFTRLKWSF